MAHERDRGGSERERERERELICLARGVAFYLQTCLVRACQGDLPIIQVRMRIAGLTGGNIAYEDLNDASKI